MQIEQLSFFWLEDLFMIIWPSQITFIFCIKTIVGQICYIVELTL